MTRWILRAAVMTAVLTGMGLPAVAQTGATARVLRQTVVRDAPRGDSVPLGSVPAGEVLDIVAQQGNWLLVVAPASLGADWHRGWIHTSAVETTGLPPAGGKSARPPGRLMIRGFGQTGGMLFDARDSFDLLIDNSFGLFHGGGGQVVLPNGAFVQVVAERFQKDGTQAVVAGDRVFAADVPSRITIRPLLFSLGYRSPASRRYAPYLGAGTGWHTVREDSPAGGTADSLTENKLGYHVLGGVEVPVARFAWLAGEVQWTTVPNAFGDRGVPGVFGEDDLGGTTFRFKIILGR